MKTRKQILLCSEGRVIKNVSLTTRSEKTTVEDHQKFISQSFSKDDSVINSWLSRYHENKKTNPSLQRGSLSLRMCHSPLVLKRQQLRIIRNLSLSPSQKMLLDTHFLARFVKNWSFCSNKKKKSPEKMIVRIHLRRYGH